MIAIIVVMFMIITKIIMMTIMFVMIGMTTMVITEMITMVADHHYHEGRHDRDDNYVQFLWPSNVACWRERHRRAVRCQLPLGSALSLRA